MSKVVNILTLLQLQKIYYFFDWKIYSSRKLIIIIHKYPIQQGYSQNPNHSTRLEFVPEWCFFQSCDLGKNSASAHFSGSHQGDPKIFAPLRAPFTFCVAITGLGAA